MAGMWAELRIAWRGLMKARGYTTAVLATLGLAIALESVVVAIVNAYLVRSLPYPAATRLYSVFYARPGESFPTGLAGLEWDALSDVIEHPISWDLDMFYLLGGDHAEAAPGAWITRGFMEGLGIAPLLGRPFAPEEFEPGGAQVALISHALWQSRFGGDAAVLGREFEAYVSDRPDDPDVFTIVGVLPPEFWHVNRYTEVITPLRARSYPYMVRLRAGIDTAIAAQRITQLVRQGAGGPADARVELRSVHGEYARSVRPVLHAIGASVTLVLLIACANVALLVLLRGIRRQREVAVRIALGASRAHVARTLASEAIVLVMLSTAAGLALAAAALRALAPAIQQQLGRPVPGGAAALSLDARVAAVIGGIALAVAVALTLVPLLVSPRSSSFALLRQIRAIGDGARGRRVRFSLIALEVAGSVALLSACGLMVATLLRMLDVKPGVEAAGVVTAPLSLRERTYADAASRIVVYERLLEATSRTPHVVTAALSTPSPFTEFEPAPIRRADRPDAGGGVASVRAISPQYFTTLRIPLLEGRTFTAHDRAGTDPVAVISETAARRLWPDGSAVGRRLRIIERTITTWDTITVERTVVGVVRDVRHAPTDPEAAEAYVPLLQAPGRFAAVVLRTSGAAVPWLTELRRIVRGIDPEISVGAVRSLDELRAEQLARPRFLAATLAAFGVFAAALALIGVYGVIAYAVRQREQEVAIRIAVGADAAAIVGLFLREAGVVVALGIAAGLAGAALIGRLLESQLYGVAAIDPATFAGAAVLLGTACVLAMGWPAWRACGTDPAIALRAE